MVVLPRTALISPLRWFNTMTPTHFRSSTSSEVTKDSSSRSILSYLSEVWKSVWSMWKPVLSAAKQVRQVVMPPKGRALILPSGSRLQGQPQCSSWMSSIGASRTKVSTTNWSEM